MGDYISDTATSSTVTVTQTSVTPQDHGVEKVLHLRPYHGRKLYPRRDATIETHTMGTSLPRYLEIKVHQEVLRKEYEEIIVMGAYNRYRSPSSIPFDGEKRDKPFNWERPTARPSEDGKILYVECFPGYDHVEHYAEIIASYLRILESPNGGGGGGAAGTYCRKDLTPSSKVSFIPSSCSDTLSALQLSTNILSFPGEGVDTVILGMVWHLSNLTGWPSTQFEAGGSSNDGGVDDGRHDAGPWQWIIRHFPKTNKRVAFLGFRPAFWGCISGEVIHLLSGRFPSIREFIYVGKLGTLNPSIPPNKFLATGSRSLVNNRIVEWENCLAESIDKFTNTTTTELVGGRGGENKVITGNHVTLGSVLHETKQWYQEHRREGMDFVDPEIGNMAQAAVRSGRRYGYLHLITDNLGEKYDEDLSNERTESVLKGRERLYQLIRDVMEVHLSGGRG